MAKFVVGDQVMQALYDNGAIDDLSHTRRVVIDLEVGSAARLYIEKFGDDEQIIPSLIAGIRVAENEEEAGQTGREVKGD